MTTPRAQYRTSNAQPRRSFVLIAVLVIVGSAILIATSVLYVAQSEAAGSSGSADAAQSRALLWSGAQAVMSRLNEQRDRILQGELPRLDSQYLIYETPQSAGVIRLLPLDNTSSILVPEAGRLDLNHVDAAALERTGLVDSMTAEAVIAHRKQMPGGRFQSVGDLLNVPNITPEMLYGPISEVRILSEAPPAEADRALANAPALADQPSARGLADILTVFAFEPALQANGRLRINLNVPWSDELGRRIAERFGQEAADAVKRIYEGGATFENEAKIFQALRSAHTPVENWPEIVDAFTTEDGEYHFGRLDLNTAGHNALLGLPGITPEQANQIVSMRAELSPQERATVAWPAIAQILPPEAYDQLAGKITTRSWTFRVRLLAGEADPDQLGGPLRNALIQEIVFDLSAPKPRIAYLRDITLLEKTAQLAAQASMQQFVDFDARTDAAPASEISTSATGANHQPATRTESEPVAAAGTADNQPAASQPALEPVAAPAAADAPARKPGQKVGRWTRGG